ncbi:MAG: helix-turn-helix domain-containing protein [Bacteroidetes bacterium]|jgi:transcriptional regulator with XRE-family HTH domain|nr:helix-turn-helix domain-containing protein [Bacteroidota bacterium]
MKVGGINMKTGLLIKELRIKKGLTQEELADLTELSARTIQRIENGEVDPRAYTLQMIAKALEVDFSLFVENTPDENQEIKKVNDNNWLGLLHLSGLLPLFFPTLILWKFKKDKTKDTANHFRAVITLQLTILGITLIGLWIYWKVNQPIPLFGGLLAGGLLSILNAINVMNSAPFLNPFIKSGDRSKQ